MEIWKSDSINLWAYIVYVWILQNKFQKNSFRTRGEVAIKSGNYYILWFHLIFKAHFSTN